MYVADPYLAKMLARQFLAAPASTAGVEGWSVCSRP